MRVGSLPSSTQACRQARIPTIGTNTYMPVSHLIFEILIISGLLLTGFVAVFLYTARKKKTKLYKKYHIIFNFIFGFSVLCFGLLFWGSYVEPRLITVQHKSIDLPHIEEPFTFVLIADYQVGVYKREGFVQKSVDTILKLNPDLVFIDGDHIDNSGSNLNELSFLDPFKELAASIPTYAVHGNHEYGIGSPDPKHYTEDKSLETRRYMEKLGIRYLVNELEEVNVASSSFYLYGQDSWWSGNANWHALENRTKDLDTIVLSHNPLAAREVQEKNIDFIMFGHTHGGQIRLPFIGPILRVDYSFPESWDKGWFTVGNTKAYTTSGMGESVTRARLFNIPEIVVFEVQ